MENEKNVILEVEGGSTQAVMAGASDTLAEAKATVDMSDTALVKGAQILEKKYMKRSEYVAFAAGKFAMTCLWSFVSGWILVFYTDVMMLPAWAVSVIMITTRIWDGINDPLMGNIADRTRTKWGKMRPWFLFSAIPICIFTILLFVNPKISMPWKIVYAFVTYILWDMTYTMCDMPMWSLPSLMSPNPKEREKYVTLGGIAAMVAGTVIGLMPNFISFAGKENQEYVFLGMGIFVGLAGLVGLLSLFKGTRERVRVPKEKAPVIQTFKEVMKNKLLMLYLASNVGGWVKGIGQGLGFYFTWYVLRTTIGGELGGDPGIVITTAMTALGIVIGIPYTIGGVFFPWIMKKIKISYRTVSILNQLIFAGVQLGIFLICRPMLFENPSFFGYFGIVIVFNFAAKFFEGLSGPADQMMLTEMMDYFEWKTGKRAEGASFSLLTLFGKISGGFVATLTVSVLSLVGYVANVDQSVETMKGIFSAYLLIPMGGAVLQALPFFFYDFVGAKRTKIYEELAQQRLLKEKNEEFLELELEPETKEAKVGWIYDDLV